MQFEKLKMKTFADFDFACGNFTFGEGSVWIRHRSPDDSDEIAKLINRKLEESGERGCSVRLRDVKHTSIPIGGTSIPIGGSSIPIGGSSQSVRAHASLKSTFNDTYKCFGGALFSTGFWDRQKYRNEEKERACKRDQNRDRDQNQDQNRDQDREKLDFGECQPKILHYQHFVRGRWYTNIPMIFCQQFLPMVLPMVLPALSMAIPDSPFLLDSEDVRSGSEH